MYIAKCWDVFNIIVDYIIPVLLWLVETFHCWKTHREKYPRAYLFHTNLGIREINIINLSYLLQNCSFPEIQQEPLYSFQELFNICFFPPSSKSHHIRKVKGTVTFVLSLQLLKFLLFTPTFLKTTLKGSPTPSYLEDW